MEPIAYLCIIKGEAAQAVVPSLGGQCRRTAIWNLSAKVKQNIVTLTQNHGKVANIAGFKNVWIVVWNPPLFLMKKKEKSDMKKGQSINISKKPHMML